MPGLVWLGRRWHIGSDDLFLPCLLDGLLRTAYTLLTLTAYAMLVNANNECGAAPFVQIFVVGSFSLHGLRIVLAFHVAILALRGTILETRKRSIIPSVLSLILICLGFEVAWNSIGTIVAFSSVCDIGSSHRLLKITTSCNWGYLGFHILFGWLFYDAAGADPKFADWNKSFHYDRAWERRCRRMCCCAGIPTDHWVYSEVARVLASLFRFLDLVPSDIIAGLILVRVQQKHFEVQTARVGPQSRSDSPLSNLSLTPGPTNAFGSDPEDRTALLELSHYAKYFLACYGWPLYVYTNLLTGFCTVLRGWSRRSRQKFPVVGSDFCCGCNVAALKRFSGVSDDDLLYVSLRNSLFEPAHYVAVDHPTKAIVLAIRGTMSLRDTMTDLTAGVAKAEIPELGEFRVHKGIWMAAEQVLRSLADHRVLEQAFQTHPGYKLVVLGHSLGAGTASCVAMKLYDSYPELRCFAYSPPGGMFSPNAAQFSRKFITSLVIGKDIVPRLGLTTLDALRKEMIAAVAHCKCSKARVLGTCCTPGAVHPDSLLVHSEHPKVGEAQQLLSDFTRPQIEAMLADSNPGVFGDWYHTDPALAPQLIPPGRILHFIKGQSEPARCRTKRRNYRLVWSEAEEFLQILVSPSMFLDHMPDRVYKVLQGVAAQVCAECPAPYRAPPADPFVGVTV
eukprot:TRINITY_DN84504_c0_g1_i1.p1 TRINITY_DN84504_c0_g1~~TRINITY_DN84504_c0_g1_i1.p1  ORF type:complete len:684 (+),score=76.07 TRINITY_DN84504_c0_g1_i1:26-2053(+)